MVQYSKQRNELLDNNNTIYEVVMLADPYGNIGSGGEASTSKDAFGRMRTAEPVTLFDSFTRYNDNTKFSTKTAGSGTTQIGADSASIDLVVDGASGAYCYRESKRVFAYQPGKSLQVLNTFCMSGLGSANLRQRVGYFSTDNGIFLELAGSTLSFVKRSQGSDTPVTQSAWNIDPLDGTGRSGLILDISKAQIFWTDIEWLGVGSVRCGFVINGSFVHCHTFHHANSVTGPYMTTACLPIRLEIENTGTTSVTNSLKQICSTVISEGGYRVSGITRSVGLTLGSERDMTVADTYYPVVAIRLKNNRRDAIVLPSGIAIQGTTNGSSHVHYKLIKGPIVSGGSWVDYDTASSSVEYNITGTSFTGGRTVTQGFASFSNQSAGTIDLKDSFFKFQLERTFDSCETFLLAIGTSNAGDDVMGSMDWDEIT